MNNSVDEAQFLHKIFDASLEGILLISDDGTILKANPASEQMFGYEIGDLVGKKVEAMIPDSFRKNHKKHRANYAKKPKARRMGQDLDLWGLKKDGSQFPIEISLSPTEIDAKSVVIVFVIDITERMSSKQALILSERRMTEAQRIAHVGNWHWNLQTNERSWSDEFYRICGLPPDDERLNGETAVNFIHSEDRKKAINAVNLAIKNQTPYQYQKRIVRPDGTIRHVIANGKVTANKNSKPIEIFGTLQDITEQIESKLRLKSEQSINKAILEAMPDMLFIQDFKGVYLHCFTPEPEKLFMPIETFIGKNMKEVLPPHVYNIVKRACDLAISSGELQIVEYGITDQTGAYFFEARVVHLNQHGILTIVRDITLQKTSDRQLMESEIKNRAMIKALPDMITELDRNGTYLNLYVPDPDIFSAPIEEVIGKTIYDFHPKERCEEMKRVMAVSEKTKEVKTLEYSTKVAGDLKYYEARIVSKGNGKFLTITRNVTAKKTIENILEVRNRALECASSSIVITDAQQPNTPIIYVNQAFLDTTGYKRTDFIGKNSRFLQGGDIDQEEIKIMSSAIKEGQACNVVLRNYRKDGSQFWNEISLTPIYNSENILTHFISVQNDITTRKKEEFFKSASNHVMDMIIQHKPLKQIGDKIIETIETAIPNCMGSILVLNKERNTLHKLSAPKIPKSFSKAIEGVLIGQNMGSCGTAAYLKKEIIVSDIEKSSLWEDYREIALANNLKACWSFPIFSSHQEVLGTFAIYSKEVRKPLITELYTIKDITRVASVAIEQDNSSNAIKQSSKKLAVYAEQLENKVAERTAELKDIVQKLTESNLSLEDQVKETKEAESKALSSMQMLDDISFNFPKGFVAVVDSNFLIVFLKGEEVAELGFKDLAEKITEFDDIIGVPENVKALIKDKIKKTLQGEHCSFEITFQNRYYLVNTTPLFNKTNRIDRVLLVHNNITLQKKAELEVFNAFEKEKELGELKSRFISMASHEFRTPLSAILSSAILIEKQNEVGKEEKRLHHVSKIRTNVKNLVVILNDFLSLSKLQEGKVAAQPEFFDFAAFSRSLVEELKGNKKKGQAIVFECQSPCIEVYLDPKLLRHIVSNLLVNAIKYSEENKKITFKIMGDEKNIFFEITDQGIGIPIENQPYLFQRFFRANNATTIQGTGLGLNIVKQYTELMGGSISFKSTLNTGSTFYVQFPINTKKDEKNIIN